jgi:hypothetical protein
MNYFVFTSARYPYEHFISSYRYCNLRVQGSFSEFCRAPTSFGRWCLDGHAAIAATKMINVSGGTPNAHWAPIYSRLCDPTGTLCPVDYVVNTGRLGETMDEVVSILNERRDVYLPALPMFSAVANDVNRNTDDDCTTPYEENPRLPRARHEELLE